MCSTLKTASAQSAQAAHTRRPARALAHNTELRPREIVTNRWKSPLSSVFIQTRTVSLRRLIRAFFSGLHGIARARRMSSLRGRLHRYAMETCSARIDLHTVFALDSLCNLTEKCSKGFF